MAKKVLGHLSETEQEALIDHLTGLITSIQL